jgi:hypothetical protein
MSGHEVAVSGLKIATSGLLVVGLAAHRKWRPSAPSDRATCPQFQPARG